MCCDLKEIEDSETPPLNKFIMAAKNTFYRSSRNCHCSYFLLNIYLCFSNMILYSINSKIIPSFPLWRVLQNLVPLAMKNDQRCCNIWKQDILNFFLVSFIYIHHCELTKLENAMFFVILRELCRILVAFCSRQD